MRRHDFTLVELIAVIVIISIGVGIASVSIRSNSDASNFEQAAQDFKAFAAQARFQAMGLGRDRAIVYQQAERKFTAADPAAEEERDEDSMNILELPERLKNTDDNNTGTELSEPANFADLSWTLPEDYELETDSNVFSGDHGQGVEIFRFYPDGSGSGSHKFTLQYRTLKKEFTISPLTGLLMETTESTP